MTELEELVALQLGLLLKYENMNCNMYMCDHSMKESTEMKSSQCSEITRMHELMIKKSYVCFAGLNYISASQYCMVLMHHSEIEECYNVTVIYN